MFNINFVWQKIVLVGVCLLLAAVSFLPEPLLGYYRISILYSLLVLLGIQIFKDRKNPLDKRDVGVWIYLLGALGGYIFACNVEIAQYQYLRLAFTGIAIYYFAKSCFKVEMFTNISKWLCLLASCVVIFGIFEFVLRENFIYKHFVDNPYYYRHLMSRAITSTQLHRTPLSTYLICCLPFSCFIIFNAKKSFWRIFGFVSFLLISGGLFLTFARMGVLMIIVALVVFFRKKRKYLFIVLAIMLVFLSSMAYTNKNFMSIYLWRFSPEGIKAALDYRLVRLNIAIAMLKDYPVVGVGLDCYRQLFGLYHPDRHENKVVLDKKIPDNMYVTILAETGIIGFLSFLIFMIMLWRRVVLKFKSLQPGVSKDTLSVLIVGLIGLMFSSLTYESLYWQMPLFFFWIFCGMIMAVVSQKEEHA